MSDHETKLLDILQAHGQQFLASFDTQQSVRRKNKRAEQGVVHRVVDRSSSPVYEDWHGINDCENIPETGDQQREDCSDFQQEHALSKNQGFMAEGLSQSPALVVFSQDMVTGGAYSSTSVTPKPKAFMSSKISKLREENTATDEIEELSDVERTNTQNDALLHHLVHTKLLSGPLSVDGMSPAKRRKSLAGRVLEVSGAARLGKGEKAVRQAEKNKASRRVRLGMEDKQNSRKKEELEEAKNLGNYHPTIKRFLGPSTSGLTSRKRDRGLKLGVGKFSGGTLKLTREDVSMVNGGGIRGRGGRGAQGGRSSRGGRRGGP